MPVAVVAGMPVGKAREFKSRIENFASPEGWSLEWVPARGGQPELRRCWYEVEEIIESVGGAGVHILAYEKTKSERRQYEKQVRFRHRLVWLDHSHLYPHSVKNWWLEVEESLRLEDAWCRAVRPSNQHHALILPSGTFASARDPWTRAQRAQSEIELEQACDEIKIFSERHKHKGRWKDDNALLFDSSGAQHAQAPTERRCKFTYQIPPAFHFDVQHESQRRFSIAGADGVQRTFQAFTNVDAHGYIRGGE